jgi:triosephosphate isomerase
MQNSSSISRQRFRSRELKSLKVKKLESSDNFRHTPTFSLQPMKYVVANWKMNLGIRESVALARGTLQALQGKETVPEVIVCPSFTALAEVRKTLSRTRMQLGAQNVGPGRSGAATGEVGVSQLEDIGCTYAIVGHSEERKAGETDELISKKVSALYETGSITPILCVGESKETRSAGEAEAFVQKELKNSLAGVQVGRRRKLLVAYEPLWAIGSGKPATVSEVLPMHQMIRETAVKLCGLKEEQIAVIYGGSVDSANAHAFLREPEIDGVLVGGASLKIQEIHAIIKEASDVTAAQESV